jgi:hypothetical protein
MLRGLKKKNTLGTFVKHTKKKNFKKINVEKITFYIFKILNAGILK